MYPNTIFNRFSKAVSHAAGRPKVFVLACVTIVLWGITGPIYGYSDTWQLIINTSTTIITFLMVFLIQSTQNRDTEAIQLKLDELIRSAEGAHNALLDLEELTDEELDRIRRLYLALATKARATIRSGGGDTDKPDILLDDN